MNYKYGIELAPTTLEFTDNFEIWYNKYKPIAPSPDDAAEEAIINTVDYTWNVKSSAIYEADPAYVWTYVNCDEGSVIVQGRHFVNRDHYYLCSVPYVQGDKDEYIDTYEKENDDE
tara:strand:+ start:153 stop:500 length:348 start_codon:yes stop_codon:yes gene_type:complete